MYTWATPIDEWNVQFEYMFHGDQIWDPSLKQHQNQVTRLARRESLIISDFEIRSTDFNYISPMRLIAIVIEIGVTISHNCHVVNYIIVLNNYLIHIEKSHYTWHVIRWLPTISFVIKYPKWIHFVNKIQLMFTSFDLFRQLYPRSVNWLHWTMANMFVSDRMWTQIITWNPNLSECVV